MQVITDSGTLEEVWGDKKLERIQNKYDLWWQFLTNKLNIQDIYEFLKVTLQNFNSQEEINFAKSVVINQIRQMLFLDEFTEEELLPIFDETRKEAYELLKKLENEINEN